MKFIEKYVEYASEFTDTPRIFHEFVALWMLSCVIGRSTSLRFGNKNLYPNVWITLLAPSGLSRKSSAIDIGESVLRAVEDNLIWPQEYSTETLVAIMADSSRGSFIYDELASFIHITNKDYSSSTKSMLTTLYGGNNYQRITGKTTKNPTTYIIDRPFVNFMAATQVSWFLKMLKSEDIVSGFLPRFLFVTAPLKREKILPFQPPDDLIKKQIAIDLLGQLKGSALFSGEMVYSPEARAAYESWYLSFIKYGEVVNPLMEPFLLRMADYCHKLGMLHAINEGQFNTIEISHFTRAKLQIDYIARGFERTIVSELGDSPFDKNMHRITSILKEKNGQGTKKADLLQRTGFSAFQLDQIILTLKQADLILEETHRSDNNRTYPVYFYKSI